MPTKRKPQITAWSYSRLGDYQQCPRKAKFKYVDRIREPSNEYMERGSKIHKLAEDYATGVLKRLPKELKLFDREFKALQKISSNLSVEQELALDKNFEPCDWFSSNAWVRAKIDLAYPVGDRYKIIDYKTGKVRPNKKEQLDLYALVTFCTEPTIDTIDASFWYLDAGEVIDRSFVRSELPRLKRDWLKNTKKMLADRTFAATPSGLCKFCHFSKRNTKGLCEY